MNSDTPSSEPKYPEKPTFKLQSIQVTFRVSPELYQAIEDTSRGKNMKSTDLMRLALSKYISSKPCTRCGSENASDARFCSTCGQPLCEEAWAGREIEDRKRVETVERMFEERKRLGMFELELCKRHVEEREAEVEARLRELEIMKREMEAAKENEDA